MNWRRILPLIALLALVLAPFGRMAAAEAIAPSHHQTMTAPGHCDDMPAPAKGKAGKTLDCLTACASLAAADSASLSAPIAMPAALRAAVPADAAGIEPEAEPPPPRFS